MYCIYIYIYIYTHNTYIYIYTQTYIHVLYTCSGMCASEGIGQQGVTSRALFVSNRQASAPCPVVLCPHLRASGSPPVEH